MKQTLWLCGLTALVFASCSKSGDGSSDDSTPTPPPATATTVPLTVEADFGQFSPNDGIVPINPKTGESFGLYVVHEDGTVAGPEKLTLGSDGMWATTLEHTEGDRYFACYPWQEQITDEVNASASTDDEFFAQMIGNWKPAKDQSDPETGLQNSLLMTASAEATATEESATLDLHFTPRTSVVLLAFPKTIYRFDNTPAIPAYEVPAPNIVFQDFTPCYSDVLHAYMYMINPKAETVLAGSYGDGTSWSKETAELPVGEVISYTVAESTEKQHTLQIGDYFLADGNLLSKDAEAATVAAADVIGLVFQIAPERIGEADKEALGGEVHGLVISTRVVADDKDATELKWCTWGGGNRDESSIGVTPPDLTDELLTNVSRAEADINGYYYTKQILTERADNIATSYALFAATRQFADKIGGPDTGVHTTGWYIPAVGQWFDVIRSLGGYALPSDESELSDYGGGTFYWKNSGNIDIPAALNKAMEKVADAQKTKYEDGGNTDIYWCSSVLSSQTAYIVGINPYREDEDMDMRISIMSNAKNVPRQARAVLSF